MAKLVPWNKFPLKIGDVPVAIISLPDAKDRRASLIERGFSPELVNGFWPACDMRSLPDSVLKNYRQYHDIKTLYGRPPVSAEIGCLFSHKAIINWLSEQNTVSQVIVFEDDVVPGSISNFEKLPRLAETLAQFASTGQPFICHLGPRPEQWKSAFTRRIARRYFDAPNVDLFDFVDRKAGLWRAHAYIMSKGAAAQYKEVVKKTGFLADDWRFIANKTMSKLILTNPPLFTQDEEVKSTIDPENKRTLLNEKSAPTINFAGLKSLNLGCVLQKGLRIFKRFGKNFLVRFYRGLPGRSIY